MTAPAPRPLSAMSALPLLQDALRGEEYATDTAYLNRELLNDAVFAPFGELNARWFRPWATAARLLIQNNRYEVTEGLEAQIKRAADELRKMQDRKDAESGITAYVLRASGTRNVSVTWGEPS